MMRTSMAASSRVWPRQKMCTRDLVGDGRERERERERARRMHVEARSGVQSLDLSQLDVTCFEASKQETPFPQTTPWSASWASTAARSTHYC
jgi:hypothetical protein